MQKGVKYPAGLESVLLHLARMPLDYSGAADVAYVTRDQVLQWRQDYPERFKELEAARSDKLKSLMVLKATGSMLPADAVDFKFTEALRVMNLLGQKLNEEEPVSKGHRESETDTSLEEALQQHFQKLAKSVEQQKESADAEASGERERSTMGSQVHKPSEWTVDVFQSDDDGDAGGSDPSEQA
jgi:hypothetical protein